MPYLITCPSCAARLKSAQPVPVGRKITCARCKHQFMLTEPAPEVADGAASVEISKSGEAPPPFAEPAQTPGPPPILPPPVPSAPRSISSALDAMSPRQRAAEEDDLPAAQFVDDDDRPRRRGRDEEDDRPRSRRRAADDDDDRPRAQRARDDDDRPPPAQGPAGDFAFDDQSKSGRRRRRQDQDDDDRPAPRQSKSSRQDDTEYAGEDRRQSARYRSKTRKGKKGLLIGLLAGGAALLFCGGGALVYFVDPFGIFGGSVPSDMLAWAPADTQSVTFIDMEEARQTDDFRQSLGAAGGVRNGIRPEEISTAFIASRRGGGLLGIDGDVHVYKLIDAADEPRIVSTLGGREANAHGKKYYRTNGGGAVHFPSSRIVVYAASETTMTTLLQKSSGTIVVSDEMRSAAKRASGTVAMASIGAAAQSSDFLSLLSLQFIKSGPNSTRATAVLVSIKLSGDRGTAKFETVYDNADTAKRVADGLKQNLERTKDATKDVDSWEVSHSGNSVTLTMKGPIKRGRSILPGFGDR